MITTNKQVTYFLVFRCLTTLIILLIGLSSFYKLTIVYGEERTSFEAMEEEYSELSTNELEEDKEMTEFQGTIEEMAESVDSWMPDKNLQAVVRQQLKPQEITKNNMKKIVYLDANNKGISSLQGLEYATELKEIRAEKNNITTFSPLKDLKKLDFMYLNNNKITDIKPFFTMKSLRYVFLENNDIVDIRDVKYVELLEYINLNRNHIWNASDLTFGYVDRVADVENQTIIDDPKEVINGKITQNTFIMLFNNNRVGINPHPVDGVIAKQSNDKRTVYWSNIKVNTPGPLVTTFSEKGAKVSFSGRLLQPFYFIRAFKVKYQDISGKKLENDVEIKGKIGDSYQTAGVSIKDYRLKEVKGGKPTGTIQDKNADVIYVYEPIPKWRVIFDSDGGSKLADQIILDKGKVKEPPKPSYINKEFKGWYVDPKFNNKYNFDTPVAKNMTLYAKWQSKVINPQDGKEILTPVDSETNKVKPQNSKNEGLRIQYVSDFNFGKLENTASEVSLNSNGEVGINTTGAKKEVTPFIAIIDDRHSQDISTWQLTAQSSEFIDAKGSKLEGSKIILSDLNYVKGASSEVPVAKTGAINISTGSEKLISESSKNLKNGSWSLAMGKLDVNKKSPGIKLQIEQGYTKNKTTYTSKIDWTITSSNI